MLRSLNISRALEVCLSYLRNLLSWLKGILNIHFETTDTWQVLAWACFYFHSPTGLWCQYIYPETHFVISCSLNSSLRLFYSIGYLYRRYIQAYVCLCVYLFVCHPKLNVNPCESFRLCVSPSPFTSYANWKPPHPRRIIGNHHSNRSFCCMAFVGSAVIKASKKALWMGYVLLLESMSCKLFHIEWVKNTEKDQADSSQLENNG